MRNFSGYLNEQNEDLKIFKVSPKYIEWVGKVKDEFKVGKLLWDIQNGIKKEKLVQNPSDYFKIEPDGMISFLKPRYFDEPEPWKSSRRMKLKVNKALSEIYNDAYLKSVLIEKDIQDIVNKFQGMFEMACRIEEFRGDDILRAYNYKKEFDLKFGHSCANFNQKELGGMYKDPTVEDFNVYTKNVENCGAVVVWDKGKIVGRRTFQCGIQECDAGNYKKGEFHMVWGNYYGIAGSGSKYDIMITDYLKRKYQAFPMGSGSGFCIKMETRWSTYPPFDYMYVCFEPTLLANNYTNLPSEYRRLHWNQSYHARCPSNLVQKRLEEN